MSENQSDDPVDQPPALDQSLEAAVKWLEAESLTPEQRASIARGTEDVSAKLDVFKAMLGVQRAARLAQNMGWLREVSDNLFSEDSRGRMRSDPYFNLSVGQFLRALQEDDTKFLTSLAKDPATITESRKKALPNQTSADLDIQTELSKLAPHNRERLRRLIQSLEAAPPASESS